MLAAFTWGRGHSMVPRRKSRPREEQMVPWSQSDSLRASVHPGCACLGLTNHAFEKHSPSACSSWRGRFDTSPIKDSKQQTNLEGMPGSYDNASCEKQDSKGMLQFKNIWRPYFLKNHWPGAWFEFWIPLSQTFPTSFVFMKVGPAFKPMQF